MQVYKAYFKIIRNNLVELSIYLIVFVLFAILLGNLKENPGDTNFQETKINVALINEDKDSKIVEGFKKYISNNVNIVDIGTSKEEFQDALYFSEVEYILKIPKGFTEKILNKDKEVTIEKTTTPNSTSEFYIDSLVNRYLNTAKRYIGTLDNISEEDLTKYISNDLDYSTNVEVNTFNDKYVNNTGAKNYYNYLAYSMFAILILGVSAVMMAFNNKDLKMRNLSSAMTIRKMNYQLILGNITYALVVWIILIISSFVMYKGYMFSINGILYLINSFMFALAALSIGLLISTVVNNKNAVSAASNVVSLGFCFISGVFVPQEFLGETVLSIAKFNPTYWYVKANEEISVLVNCSRENLMPIIYSILIVMAFAITIIAVTLVAMKQKRVENYS